MPGNISSMGPRATNRPGPSPAQHDKSTHRIDFRLCYQTEHPAYSRAIHCRSGRTARRSKLKALWDHGFGFTVDLLGEATVNEPESEAYAGATPIWSNFFRAKRPNGKPARFLIKIPPAPSRAPISRSSFRHGSSPRSCRSRRRRGAAAKAGAPVADSLKSTRRLHQL